MSSPMLRAMVPDFVCFRSGLEYFDRLVRGLLDVLEYLHGRAPPVFHRDIKPSNILVRDDATPVLIDFGGVCFGWRPAGQVGTTVVGTFGYMPPEQGDAVTVLYDAADPSDSCFVFRRVVRGEGWPDGSELSRGSRRRSEVVSKPSRGFRNKSRAPPTARVRPGPHRV